MSDHVSLRVRPHSSSTKGSKDQHHRSAILQTASEFLNKLRGLNTFYFLFFIYFCFPSTLFRRGRLGPSPPRPDLRRPGCRSLHGGYLLQSPGCLLDSILAIVSFININSMNPKTCIEKKAAKRTHCAIRQKWILLLWILLDFASTWSHGHPVEVETTYTGPPVDMNGGTLQRQHSPMLRNVRKMLTQHKHMHSSAVCRSTSFSTVGAVVKAESAPTVSSENLPPIPTAVNHPPGLT
ncbi:hypothetical protein BDP81DRAFT_92044 [Colletotrichum phormii]|uniref:Uncharacterized protein n=1 Tax=Colletotrichum phormii TaxID=359342 RepID=A0AAJ0A1Y1_9PEZI|nr:uncharacterized protein BDP81DRAFT_92044 [Colletotrichum phormii]KAK1654973.1 hypothetical protein BDP81DRAFT_92044 [Colletotrichum phormii]